MSDPTAREYLHTPTRREGAGRVSGGHASITVDGPLGRAAHRGPPTVALTVGSGALTGVDAAACPLLPHGDLAGDGWRRSRLLLDHRKVKS